MASGPITSWQIDGETVADFICWGSKITADSDCCHEIKRCLLLGRKAITNLDSNIKKQRHCFANKGPSSQSYGFSSSHVCMWELGYKESWAQKNWCFWTVVLEKTPESPMDCLEIQPVKSQGKKKKNTRTTNLGTEKMPVGDAAWSRKANTVVEKGETWPGTLFLQEQKPWGQGHQKIVSQKITVKSHCGYGKGTGLKTSVSGNGRWLPRT